MIKWKDVSSYSQTDKEREPKAYEVRVGFFRLVVHRHIHYPKTTWLASCDLFSNMSLSNTNINSAKEEALQMLKIRLTQSLSAIESVME